MNIFETLASVINLNNQQENETDYGTCLRHVDEHFDNSELNELCRSVPISTRLSRHNKIAMLVQQTLEFDSYANLISQSNVQVDR